MARKRSLDVLGALRRLFCDWGWTKPTRKPGEEFAGAPAPLWDNPAPRLFLIGALLALVIWLAMLGMLILKVKFDIACEIERINAIKDVVMIAMLVDFVYLFRMSSFGRTDDKHWSRTIVIMFTFTLIYLIVATLLILIKVELISDDPKENCVDREKEALEIIPPLVAMVLIYAAGKITIVLVVTLNLYMKTAKFISRNKDEAIAQP